MTRDDVERIVAEARDGGQIPDLSCADLSSRNLTDAKLRGANLWGANLWGADLRGADLPAPDEELTQGSVAWRPAGGAMVVWSEPGGTVRARNIDLCDLDPHEARAIGLALFAAANHAEQENRE